MSVAIDNPLLDALLRPLRGGMFYLATPYTNFVGGLDAAYDGAARGVALLFLCGVHAISPICCAHRAAALHALPKDHDPWLAFDRALIDRLDGVIVYQMAGWRESRGVEAERLYAQASGKRIVFMPELRAPEPCPWPGAGGGVQGLLARQ